MMERFWRLNIIGQWISVFMKRFMPWLPGILQRRLLHSEYPVENFIPLGLQFKKAEEPDEIKKVLEIIPYTKFLALPTSHILIAKWKGEVVAAVSVVMDSAMGLPAESLLEDNKLLSELRKENTKLAEVSMISVKDGFYSQKDRWLLPLCKFAYEYCSKVLNIHSLVAQVGPESRYFFRDILMFDEIARLKGIRNHRLAICHINGLAQQRLKSIYSGKVSEKYDYKSFFLSRNIKNFIFPENSARAANSPSFTPELLENFLKNQSNIFDQLTEQEKNALTNLYFYPQYKSVIGFENKEGHIDRKQARFHLICSANLSFQSSGRMMNTTVLEASRNGLKVRLPNPLTSYVGEDVQISVSLNPDSSLKLRGRIVWVLKELQQVGIEMEISLPTEWNEFIDLLEEKHTLPPTKLQVLKKTGS